MITKVAPGVMRFDCNNFQTLKMVQDICDGNKVRLEDAIIFPTRALPKIAKLFPNWRSMMSEDIQKIMIDVSENIKKRKATIKQIRDEYGNDEMLGYKVAGQYAPLKHQITMFRAVAQLDCAAILADPGTCKTGAYLWGIDYKIKHGQVKKCLIVTLSHLKENVQDEMKKQTPDLTSVILWDKKQADCVLNKKYKNEKKNKDYDIYIANYESMFSLVELFEPNYFQMVVLDEAHRIGSPRSRQTKTIVDFFELVPYKFIVTGTLNANSHTSFYMPFRFMGPDTVPEATFWSFRQKHFYTVDADGHIWIPSPDTHQLVKDLIGRVSICFTKDQCLDLPPKVYEVVKCEMEKSQLDQYEEVKKELVFTIQQHCKNCPDHDTEKCLACENRVLIKNVLVQIGKLNQITCGFFIKTKKIVDPLTGSEKDASEVIWLDKNPKLNMLISTLNNIPSNKKVIIWSHYVAAIKLIEAKIKEAFGHDSYISVFGDCDAFAAVEKFKSDNKIKYMIANPKKAGTGLNIQFSSYQIFFSNDYSYVARDQAESRQHRKGQEESVTIIDTVCAGAIDEKILGVLMNKKDLAMDLSSLAKVAGI